MSHCILTAAVLSIVFATVYCHIADYDESVRRGNEFVDKVLQDIVQDHGHEYDPYEMEESVIGFHKKVMFVNISGEAKLHEGHILGLSTLHRPDNCNLEEENGMLKVRAELGAGVLDMMYSGTAKFMNFGPTISVHGKVAYVEVMMKISVDGTTGKGAELEDFYIEDIKGMQVWITGLGPINWAVNSLISGVTYIFKGYLHRLVERKIESHISDKIGNYIFPVDGIDVDSTSITEFLTKTSSETEATVEVESSTVSETEGTKEPEPEPETIISEPEPTAESEPEPTAESEPEPTAESEPE